MAWWKTTISLLLTHWRYWSLALSHRLNWHPKSWKTRRQGCVYIAYLMPFDIYWWNTDYIFRGSTESAGIDNVFRLMYVLWVGVWHRRRQYTSNIFMDHSYKPIGYMLFRHKSSSVTCIYGVKPYHSIHLTKSFTVFKMTSSNGNISALLALSAGNSPVPGEFPAQRPVTPSFDVFFDLHPIKR